MDSNILTLNELCDYIKAKPRQVYELTHRREIPFIKVGQRRLRFSKTEIDQWLQENSHPVETPREPEAA